MSNLIPLDDWDLNARKRLFEIVRLRQRDEHGQIVEVARNLEAGSPAWSEAIMESCLIGLEMISDARAAERAQTREETPDADTAD